MGKLPSFQFYPGDWLQDNVAGCSLAAQGLWVRMMFVMHSAERRGYLSMNGKAMSEQSIAARCGCDVSAYQSLLRELFDAGVPRRTSDGIIFNKRMVEDERERQANRQYQSKHRSKTDVREMSGESKAPSSSSTSSSTTKQKPNTAASPFVLPDWIPAEQWQAWLDMRSRIRRPATYEAKRLAVKELSKLKEQGSPPLDVLNQSILNSWQGLFALKDVTNGSAPKIAAANKCTIAEHRGSGTGPMGQCWGCYQESFK